MQVIEAKLSTKFTGLYLRSDRRTDTNIYNLNYQIIGNSYMSTKGGKYCKIQESRYKRNVHSAAQILYVHARVAICKPITDPIPGSEFDLDFTNVIRFKFTLWSSS